MSSFVTLIQNAFGWIEATSIRVSVLIVAVVILRAVLGRWLTAGLRYALSILILAGLLIPLTPRSALSLENLFRKSDDFSNSNPAQLAPVPSAMLSTQATHWARSLSLHQVAALVWLAGCLALVIIALWRHRKLRRLIADGIPVHDSDLLGMLRSAKESMGVRCPISLAVTERLDTPAIFGLRQTRLLLPAPVLRQLAPRELRMVMLHELAHVRRNDLLVNWILVAGQFLHWFNPLVWLALHRFRADRELVCDAMVLQQLQSTERPEYGKVLLKLLEGLRSESLLASGAIPVISGRREMRERIILIKHHRKASVAACLGMALLVAGLGCATLTRAREPKSAVTNTALAMNVTNVSATRLEKEPVNPPVSSDASTNVVRIDIKRIGPTRVGEEFIRSNISLAVGHAFNLSIVDNDVRKLYATGHFYSVRVATEPSPAGSIVSYILQDLPRVKAIKFSGNKRFSDAELLRAILTKVDGPFNERKVFTDTQLIQKQYHDAGFKNTQVRYHLALDEKSGRGTITFKVEENPEGADGTSRPRSIQEALYIMKPDSSSGPVSISHDPKGAERVSRKSLLMSKEVGTPSLGDDYERELLQCVSQRWGSLVDQLQGKSSVDNPLGEGKVILNCQLHSDGKITDLQVTESNVTDAFCRLCEAAVLDPSPFRPWPPSTSRQIRSDRLLMTFTFYY